MLILEHRPMIYEQSLYSLLEFIKMVSENKHCAFDVGSPLGMGAICKWMLFLQNVHGDELCFLLQILINCSNIRTVICLVHLLLVDEALPFLLHNDMDTVILGLVSSPNPVLSSNAKCLIDLLCHSPNSKISSRRKASLLTATEALKLFTNPNPESSPLGEDMIETPLFPALLFPQIFYL